MKAEVHFDDGDLLPITLQCKDSFEAMNLLRDVIERDTAMKPIPNIVDGYYIIYCPRCHNRRFIDASYNFCPDCGQRLKWDAEC